MSLAPARNYQGYLAATKELHMRSDLQSDEARSGKIGWIILWLLGIPLPILLVLFLIRGYT